MCCYFRFSHCVFHDFDAVMFAFSFKMSEKCVLCFKMMHFAISLYMYLISCDFFILENFLHFNSFAFLLFSNIK